MSTQTTVPGGTHVGTFGGFAVVVVRRGDKWGLNNCLTHEKDDPLVGFYDIRYKSPGFTTLGQFVSNYYLSTLRADAPRLRASGLCLDGGVPAWRIDGESFVAALAAVDALVGGDR